MNQARIGDSQVRCFRTRDLYDQGQRLLRRDPLYLVSADTRERASEHMPAYGRILEEGADRPLRPLPCQQPLRAALARLLCVCRAPKPARVEVRNRWEIADDGLALEELRFSGGVNPIVPAMLALPLDRSGPVPVVICLSGTGGTWERVMERPFFFRGSTLIGWGRELARRGFAVLALTQWAQPPRPEPWNWEGSKLLQVHGQTAMGRLVADVVEGVDYLETRAEVDARKAAVAGFSLGGIVSFYSFALDDRLVAGVSICGGVGSVRLVAAEAPLGFHSVYYYVPGIVAAGLDHPLLTPALAPRPLLVCGATEDDGMPLEGLREFEAAGGAAYAQAGAPGNFRVQVEEGPHALTASAFEATASWLSEHLGVDGEAAGG